MIVVAVFLSLAILPTARAADETVWAPDDPVDNLCAAVSAVVSAPAVVQGDPVINFAVVQSIQELVLPCLVPF